MYDLVYFDCYFDLGYFFYSCMIKSIFFYYYYLCYLCMLRSIFLGVC